MTDDEKAQLPSQTDEILALRRTLAEKDREIERLQNELLDSDAKLAILRRDRTELLKYGARDTHEKCDGCDHANVHGSAACGNCTRIGRDNFTATNKGG